MTKNKPPFRYDIVGSFLRPAALKEKREAFAAGTITAADLKAAEDEAIRDLVAKEKEVGLYAVTDGEFRRRYWHLDFLTELEGVTEISAENWSVHFKGAQPKARTARITGLVDFGKHPFLDHFKAPVTINSGYRTEAKNKAVGGAAYSQHKYGTAADIVVKGVPPAEVAKYAETILVGMGGIGIYNGFTHIDVRKIKSRWKG